MYRAREEIVLLKKYYPGIGTDFPLVKDDYSSYNPAPLCLERKSFLIV